MALSEIVTNGRKLLMPPNKMNSEVVRAMTKASISQKEVDKK